MSIMGYYDGTAVRVDEPLQMNQKVIVIPVETGRNLRQTAAGGLRKFRNGYMLDANAVLRFLLQDVEDQFRQVKNIIQKEKCYITLEVIAEVCYVLESG